MSDASSKPKIKTAEKVSGAAKFSSVPWGPAAAIVVALLTFVGAQIAAALILLLGAKLLGISDMQVWLETISAQFAFVLASEGLIILGLWLFLRKRKGTFAQLGFARKPAWKDAGYALAGYLIYFALFASCMALLIWLTPIDTGQRQNLGFQDLASRPEILMAFISLVVLPPIVEETVFRGFLFQGMRKKLTLVWAAVITSLLFGALHLFGGEKGLLWTAAIDTFVLSLALCYLREKTGALWAPILVHTMKNSLAFLVYIGLIAT